MSQETVRRYYAAFDEKEWSRLAEQSGVIEFAVTTHALQTYLPKAGRILDLGGGPGRYSIWLAARGYQVVLADLSPNLLEIARKKIIEAGVQAHMEDIVVADACDLGRYADNAFDAILCLGPFYHLTEASDRERAATELVRVLRPGGVAFVAFMPIYNFLRRTLALADERQHLGQPEFVDQLMQAGVFWNDVPGRFSAGYGVRPEEIAPFWEQRGLNTVALLADTSFAATNARDLEALAQSDAEAYARVMKLIVDTASDPSLWGTSVHLVYVGRKSG